MTPVDCLDLGAALAPTEPCLVSGGATLSYAETQGLSRSVAASLEACGVEEGDTVGLLGVEDPLVAACLFGASRVGAAWASADPADTPYADVLHRLDACTALLFRATHAALAGELRARLPRLRTLVCLDGRADGALGWGEFLVAGMSRAMEH